MERLILVRNQLASIESPKKTMEHYRSLSTINIDDFRNTFFGSYYEQKVHMHKIMLNSPHFKQAFVDEPSREELRRRVWLQMKEIAKNTNLSTELYLKSPLTMFYFNSGLLDFDGGLSTKFGVHLALYARAILNLGTMKHRKYVDAAFEFKEVGCFALTELAHGSNTRGILTRADYDHETRTFVINTPEDIAMKFWIGAAAHLATNAVVWAQLYIKDKAYGIHAFIVPLRNKNDHTPLPGIQIGDCGAKVGVNNIDNGFLIFKDVRIPYDNLLDRFSSIDEQGNFQSPIKNPNKRFALTLGTLSAGRISVTDSALVHLRNALSIALRFACVRRQFGAPGQPETTIIEYPLTQYRLIPYLAYHFALGFSNYSASDLWHSNQEALLDEKNPLVSEIHALTSTLKAFGTWHAVKGIQECREVCGGLGYSAYNRLGALREDNDINTTWEGDNNVLLQQTAKFLLDNLNSLKGGEKVEYPTVYFLTENPPELKVVDGKSPFAQEEYNLKKALETRANVLVHESLAQLQQNMEKLGDGLSAWNHTQIYYLQSACKAYGELYMYNEFHKKLKRSRDENTKKVFQTLLELFGYDCIVRDLAVFLEIGYLNRKDAELVREKVRQLCGTLKSEVAGIIDAIAPPDGVLNSPIGASDGDIYNRFINAVWTAPRALEKPSYWKEIHH